MNIKRFCIVIILALMTGCATAPTPKISAVFYPSPPDLPRLQFLTSFTGEKDIVSKRSAFATFITGVNESRQKLDKPYGAAIWSGKIYVCDTNIGVVVFDLEKRTYGGLQGAQGMGRLIQPLNIRIDADGTKYVSDTVRGQVVVFDKNDFYVTAYGSPDAWKPVDAIPFGDELFVADMKHGEIVVVDKKSGDILRKFGREGEPAQQLYRPTNLAFNKEGRLFVSDIGRFQIVKFDRDGHILGMIGALGSEGGSFSRPKGIAIDREDRLFVVDAAFDNVQFFDKDGGLLFFFGGAGITPGDMYLPTQVVVDYNNIKYFQPYADPKFDIENLVIVVNQFGNRLINIYGFGKEKGKHYPTDAELREQLKAKLEKAAKEKAEKEKATGKKDEPEKEKQGN